MKTYKCNEANAGVRADIFLTAELNKYSRSTVEQLFEAGMVLIDNSPAKPSYHLKNGDELVVDDSLLTKGVEPVELPVIYEDDNVVVIDKPAGILTHAKGSVNTEASVATFIASKLTDRSLNGNRAGIAHRLDRDTSGVIITAKNAKTLKLLQSQFSKRLAKKEYYAVVEGEMTPERAIIDAPIIRNPAKPQTFKVDASGKTAQTEYQVEYVKQTESKKYSLLLLKPRTGRTHQLRVHLAYLGHPIVGDRIYSKTPGDLMLHATKLEITIPNGDRRIFTSPLPDRFRKFTDD